MRAMVLACSILSAFLPVTSQSSPGAAYKSALTAIAVCRRMNGTQPRPDRYQDTLSKNWGDIVHRRRPNGAGHRQRRTRPEAKVYNIEKPDAAALGDAFLRLVNAVDDSDGILNSQQQCRPLVEAVPFQDDLSSKVDEACAEDYLGDDLSGEPNCLVPATLNGQKTTSPSANASRGVLRDDCLSDMEQRLHFYFQLQQGRAGNARRTGAEKAWKERKQQLTKETQGVRGRRHCAWVKMFLDRMVKRYEHRWKRSVRGCRLPIWTIRLKAYIVVVNTQIFCASKIVTVRQHGVHRFLHLREFLFRLLPPPLITDLVPIIPSPPQDQRRKEAFSIRQLLLFPLPVQFRLPRIIQNAFFHFNLRNGRSWESGRAVGSVAMTAVSLWGARVYQLCHGFGFSCILTSWKGYVGAFGRDWEHPATQFLVFIGCLVREVFQAFAFFPKVDHIPDDMLRGCG
ncbi:hypothetical protein NMY22_g3964 [Coprinellus aureogranulatus]|nr:hypothetical protein NMY22_g3964 [Coprinellus aureogranulatus]